jgi:hypothetical protein
MAQIGEADDEEKKFASLMRIKMEILVWKKH